MGSRSFCKTEQAGARVPTCVHIYPTCVYTPTHMHTHARPPSLPLTPLTHTWTHTVSGGGLWEVHCGAAWGSPVPQGLSLPAQGPQPGNDLGLQACTAVRAAPHSHRSAARPEARGPSSEAVHTDRLSE